jgi:hypothetical protein
MTQLEVLALAFSGLCAIIAVAAFLIPRNMKESLRPWPYSVPDEMPGESIGGSEIRLVPGTSEREHPGLARFSTLRCSVRAVTQSQSLTEVRFIFLNASRHDLVFDDLHVKIYERQAIHPLLATIDYYGAVRLRADNTIAKAMKTITVLRGNGAEMTLMVAARRFEGMLAQDEKPGALRVIFGILLDYYFFGQDGIVHRRAIPSDCLYLLEHDAAGVPTISAWDHERLAQLAPTSRKSDSVKQVQKHYAAHKSLDLVPGR